MHLAAHHANSRATQLPELMMNAGDEAPSRRFGRKAAVWPAEKPEPEGRA
jgi:hypothetical protein